MFDKVDVAPRQIPVAPDIAAAGIFTVIGYIAVVVPHELVTV
jgi:hypothetical protein